MRTSQKLLRSSAAIFLAFFFCLSAAHAQSTETAAFLSPVYPSTTSAGIASYVRVTNSASSGGVVEAEFRSGETGAFLGTWTGEVPAGASIQFHVADMEEGAGITPSGGATYSLAMRANFTGFVQHVLWNAAGSALTNLTSCGTDISTSGLRLGNVHTSLISGYPSTIVVQNTGAAVSAASFDVFDSATVTLIAGGYSRSVPAGGTWTFSVDDFAADVGFTPNSDQPHISFVLNGGFTGFAQHVVSNEGAGVISNMTAQCVLPVSEMVGESVLGVPSLPAAAFNYANINLPAHFTQPVQGFGDVTDTDNTPNNNPVTDAGATLGRVLFYDKRLSANDTISCSSCHIQEFGFSDPRQFSVGFEGGLTGRNSMGLANARYYERGRFFWDERADTLEDQVLMPIQDSVEMGMDLNTLEAKLASTSFYPDLFDEAFGSPQVTSERISLALAQFVRSMVSYQSKFDSAFNNGNPNFNGTLTAQENLGRQLFFSNNGSPNCDSCHETVALTGDQPRNNGLDANTSADQGAGGGEFKAPSLRNIAVTGPYMHDGRFETLAEVVEHYNSGIQDHPNLANQLQQNNQPEQLNLTQQEKDALVAFLETLTDETFLADPKFSDPFPE